MKHLSLILIAMIISVFSYAQAPAPISGPAVTCLGEATTYTSSPGGGTWSSSDDLIATIGTASGVLYGNAGGVVSITYTLPTTAYATYTVTVVPAPGPLSGPSFVCIGGSISLTDPISGGTWSSSNTAVASVSSLTGIVTGGVGGTAFITYAIGTGCTVTAMVTVSAAPPSITGSASVCVGSATALTGAGGGTWSSAVPGIATVGSATGIVSGAAPGTSTITYSLGAGCSSSVMVTVSTMPVAITGPSAVCVGATLTLTDATGGGTWSSSNTAVAFAGAATGVITGVATGASTISYSITPSCFATHPVTVALSTTAIGGATSVCSGSSTTLTDGLAGGIWSSSNTVVVSVGSLTGIVTGGASGTSVITYSIGTGCFASAVVTVSSAPAAFSVAGGGAYCAGGAGMDITLSGSSSGVSYQLYNGATPVGVPVPGTGSGLDFGAMTAAGTYGIAASSGSCSATMTGSVTITINPLPVTYAVTGGGSYCTGGAGEDVGVANSDPGISYQLFNGGTAVGAAIPGVGAALDFGVETAAGTYMVAATNTATGCTSNMSGSAVITISSLPTVTLGATAAGCDGSYTLIGGGAASYSWAPATGLSCTTCSSPTVNPTATTSYTITGTDGSGCSNTASISVDGNRISGTISPTVSGTIEVWLVQFNPADSSIIALDSMAACTSGGTQYYNFADPASGNYMVKAYLLGGTPGASGYIPTYSSSAAHWDAAATVSHASATDNLNVTMIYGTVPSGPGFIGGYIASGAGKSTSPSAPVAGMLVYLTDASGSVLTYTYTDVSGNYGFTGLANGDYIIYPEFYQFTTTSSSVITLSAATETISGINFKQHTSNRTITPYDFSVEGVKSLTANGGSVMVYPNPASGDLNIQWENQTTGSASVVITDVAGREVYRSTINISTASGQAQIGMDGMNNGIYLVTIKSEGINYSGKVVVEK